MQIAGHDCARATSFMTLTESGGVEPSGLDPKRILHVEDSRDMQSLVKFVLYDYDLTTVELSNEGLEVAREGGFDLIILDHYLPDGHGTKLCSMIREFDDATPILFVTNAHDVTITDVLAIGASGIVRKGSSRFVDELREWVYDLITDGR